MAYILSNSEWQNLNQTIYRINTEEDRSLFLYRVMRHINLLCPYSSGIINLVRITGNGPKIYDSKGINLLPEDTDTINRFALAQSSFIRGICMLPGGSVSCGFSREQFTESQKMSFRSSIIPCRPDHTLVISLYHDAKILGYILLMRRDVEQPFSDSDICAVDMLRHHISLQLFKVLRDSEHLATSQESKIKLEVKLAGYGLTKREIEILSLLLDHKTDETVCDELYITPSTLKKHLGHIYKKINAGSRTEMFRFADSLQKS